MSENPVPRVSVVCFKYNTPGYRTRFTSHMVNSLYKSVADHLGLNCPIEFVCITDEPKGIMGDIFTRKMLPTFRNLRNPTSGSRPNCYPRLALFDPSNPYRLNTEYFISIDLDALAVGDVSPLIQHWQDFIVYKVRGHFCGSMFGGRIGGRASALFTDFDPVRTPMLTNARGLRGSDQAWFEHRMPDAPTWEAKDGVLGWQDDIGFPIRAARVRARPNIVQPRRGRLIADRPACALPLKAQPPAPPPPVGAPRDPAVLPAGARIVHFYGEPKAWSPEAQRLSPWIKTYLR